MKRKTLRSAHDLISAGLVDEPSRHIIERVAERYSVAIPPYISDLITTEKPLDPVARQYVPDTRELTIRPGELGDPIGDAKHSPVAGIVHRYKDRVLLKIVHICPVYCRFCFRREMVGPGHEPNLSSTQLAAALAYIVANAEISEVILTGGDPFVLAPHRVAELTDEISNIPHIKKIRWHTRMPVVDPEKITATFASALTSNKAQTIVAIHANHPREFTSEAISAIATLRAAGIALLSQSVLLKEINDDADTLTNLIKAFASNEIKPYYIHHGDLAPGTSHFRTTIAQGIALVQAAQSRLPEHLHPTYILDIPGGFSKVNLLSQDTRSVTPSHWQLRDNKGQWHDYHEEPSLFGKHFQIDAPAIV